jgi:topoisomerase-4 subunit A
VAAFYCREAVQLFAITAEGQTMSFLSEKAPLTDRKDTGKLLAPVEKKDEIVNVLLRSEPQASQSIE